MNDMGPIAADRLIRELQAKCDTQTNVIARQVATIEELRAQANPPRADGYYWIVLRHWEKQESEPVVAEFIATVGWFLPGLSDETPDSDVIVLSDRLPEPAV